jgi:hypothetical protein
MRLYGPAYSQSHAMFKEQRRAMVAIASCRTAALGGHVEACERCSTERQAYNSCRDRHCPKCGGILTRKWLAEQLGDLLPVTYFHSVFTLPSSFNILVPRNEKTIYNALFAAATDTLKALAWRYWQAEPGIIAVLHSWGQTMMLHPHIHCIVTGGGLSIDGSGWVRNPSDSFLFDVHECSNEFRKRFCRQLRRGHGEMTFSGDTAAYACVDAFAGFIAEQEARDWVVYTQPPAAGEAVALRYLSRYVHRVAISNSRILDLSADGMVTFDYKDYATVDAAGVPVHKRMTLSAVEFIGRFLRHVLPDNFRRIRHYGILAPAGKADRLARIRQMLKADEPDAMSLLESISGKRSDHTCSNCGHDKFRTLRELAADFQGMNLIVRPFASLNIQEKAGAIHHSRPASEFCSRPGPPGGPKTRSLVKPALYPTDISPIFRLTS